MLKFTERSKTPGMTSKTNIAFPEENNQFCRWFCANLDEKKADKAVSPKRNICWYRTQKLPKNLNIYLRNYQTETAIFLATKHEKQLWHAVI